MIQAQNRCHSETEHDKMLNFTFELWVNYGITLEYVHNGMH